MTRKTKVMGAGFNLDSVLSYGTLENFISETKGSIYDGYNDTQKTKFLTRVWDEANKETVVVVEKETPVVVKKVAVKKSAKK